MAAPYFITPNYFRNPGVTDTQEILDDLATLLPAIGWSIISQAAGSLTLESPPDPWGRFIRLGWSQPDGLSLYCIFRDDQLRSPSNRRFNMSASTHPVEYYYGTRYLYIVLPNQSEGMLASLLSLSPESETVHNMNAAFYASRTDLGSLTGQYMGMFSVMGVSAYDAQTTYRVRALRTAAYDSEAAGARFRNGVRGWHSVWVFGQEVASVWNMRGRMYNLITARKTDVTAGAEYVVSVDEGETRTFKALSLPVASAEYHGFAAMKS